MKIQKTTFLMAGAMLALSCNNTPKQEQETSQLDSTGKAVVEETQSTPTEDSPKFSLESIPLSSVEMGDFPFFTAPEGAEYINRAKPVDFDFIVFVTSDNIFEVEGKTFRAHVHKVRRGEKEISGRYLIKSYEDAITQAGGVKVFEGPLKGERLEKYKELCTYGGSNGSIDVWNNEIATYVIRREDGNIYIALDKGKRNTTSIQIVQEKTFLQTIKKVTSDEIVKDLTQKGKSILYINFDVDKSTVTSEGKDVVDQIAEALQKSTSLKVAIEGHTDNTGNATHNKRLSNDRAAAVMNALIENGIAQPRLTAKGFGAEKPLVTNDSEENRAKNRRVELVKLD